MIITCGKTDWDYFPNSNRMMDGIVMKMLFGLVAAIWLLTANIGLSGVKSRMQLPLEEGEQPIVFIIGDGGEQILDDLSGLDVLGIWLGLDVAGKAAADAAASFEAYREELNRALHDASPDMEGELYGKGTFSQVLFVGAGEGAESVLEIVRQQHGIQMDVSHVLLLGPTLSREVTLQPLPDVPITICAPTTLFEENVVSLTYFQTLRSDPSRMSESSLIFVESASGEDDGFEKFLSGYIPRKVREIFLGTDEGVGLYANRPVPVEMLQMSVKSALLLPNDTKILNPKRFGNPHENCLEGKNRFFGTTVNHYKGVTDHYLVEADPGGTLLMEFPQGQDMCHREALSLYYSYSNPHNKPIDVLVEFEDVDGQTESIRLLGLLPFNFGFGALHPFYQERIPLQLLGSVDLTSIVSITLVFETGIEGVFKIGDISLSGYNARACGQY